MRIENWNEDFLLRFYRLNMPINVSFFIFNMALHGFLSWHILEEILKWFPEIDVK